LRDELEDRCLELSNKEEDIRQLSAEIENERIDIREKKQQFEEKINENMQLQKELDINLRELESREQDVQQIKQQFMDKCDETTLLQTELNNMHREIDLKDKEFESLLKEIDDTNMEMKASKSALNWFKSELENKREEVRLKDERIRKNELEINDIKKQLENNQALLEKKTKSVEQLRIGLDQLKSELRTKDEELANIRLDMENKTKDVKELRAERDRLDFCLRNMNDTIPSSIVMINRDGVITSCNKKAEETLGLDTGKALGKNIFEIELMGKERLREGLKQCQKDKKSVTVKSISIKDQHGDVCLTDVSHMPVIDSNGEIQGAVMVINDISEITKMQAELKQKQHDLENLDNRFQETYTKLKLVNMGENVSNMNIKTDLEKENKEINHITGILDEKRMELDSLNKSIALKASEFGDISVKLEEGKSALSLIQSELEKKQKEAELSKMPGEGWKEKLKIYDEIDKCLDASEDKLKTKKLSDEELK